MSISIFTFGTKFFTSDFFYHGCATLVTKTHG